MIVYTVVVLANRVCTHSPLPLLNHKKDCELPNLFMENKATKSGTIACWVTIMTILWNANKCPFLPHLNSRHIQSNNQPPQPPVPPLGYMSGALISDLETDVPDDDADDEDEALEIPRPLRVLEQTPGSSMDNLDSSVTGNRTVLIAIAGLFVTLKCIKNEILSYVRAIPLHLFL